MRLPSLFALLVSISSSALSMPPAPPAPHTWIRLAWECWGKQRSSLEIEQLAQGETGYRTRILGLVISGRKIDPATIPGMNEMLARRNYLRPGAEGYCEIGGEAFGIEEIATGPKRAESGWRRFYVPY